MGALARLAACGVAVAGLLLAGGCGKPTGKAAGKVTFNGTPVAGAELTFTPEGSTDAAVFGTSADDGTYHLNYLESGGIPVGKYRVTVCFYTLRSGKLVPGGEVGVALRGDETKTVKHCYTFDRQLEAGANEMSFEVTQGQKTRP